ncbi:MAG: AAA family ATPase [Defluviicoccus sp.]|nr:AAA family ATPase [Defluviicoccus sp.]MDG4593206.1 AAA family ATPase [Defluviicoccus sp.]
MREKAPAAPSALPAEALFAACDETLLPFATTAELPAGGEIVGQGRATEALRLALGMKAAGYNLFALGPSGVGKFTFVRHAVEQAARRWPTPPDWCYINNFAEPHRPKALELPSGRGRPLQQEAERLIEELQQAIPAAFETDEYRNRKSAIQEQFKERQEEAFSALQAQGRENDVALIKTPMGLALAPTKDGDVLSPQDFEQLSGEEKQRRQEASERLQKQLEAFLREVPGWEREQREQLRTLNRETTQYAVGHLIDEMKKHWEDLPAVLDHLEAVRADVIENVDDFLPKEQTPQILIAAAAGRAPQGPIASPFRRYQVNVIVDQQQRGNGDGANEGAPVVHEDHPTLPNLVGRIEHIAQFGTLMTDFMLIKAGALHRANGGCLILDVRRVLMNSFAYETLKRVLRSGCIRIESVAESLGWSTTITLEPAPIPLDVKVILLGDPLLYYLLSAYDPEFSELFRVAADFDTRMDRDAAGTQAYAQMIATIAGTAKLKPIDRGGVARLIEHGARLVGDAEKLTAHAETLEGLLREADFWAGEADAGTIGRAHVQQAIDARTYRSDLLRARIQEEIQRGTLVIETDGARVGQINGLAVIQLNHFAFGRPSRISCRVRLGKGEVIDIEREVALGGPLHSKGVLILSAFLSSRYAHEQPLSLNASLVFEQSYSGVEGDSASSAELYALLSALAEIPIRQSLAVTGSVDQQGRVQAIGGVNEKIEGFFDICAARGLSGEQGVLIPAANVKHLMLRADVVAACREGRFAVYPVETIDQGITLLTGIPAGEADEKGEYPLGTVNRAVANRLARFVRKAVRLAREADGGKGNRNAKGREALR